MRAPRHHRLSLLLLSLGGVIGCGGTSADPSGACHAGEGPQSRSCTVAHGAGTQQRACAGTQWASWGTCQPTSCDAGFQSDGQQCLPATCDGASDQPCDVPHGIGTQQRTCSSGTWSGWGVCTVVSCDPGFAPQGNACVATTCDGASSQPCTITNGTGAQTRTCGASGSWSEWGACQVTACDPGYQQSGGTCVADPACATGAVTTPCRCGSTTVTTGYCCSGVSQGGPCTAVEVADYYVSPSGDDGNVGDQAHPFKSFEKAHSVASAGDLVYFMGGTYHPRNAAVDTTTLSGRSGTAGNLIRFWGYPGDTVVFDFSTMTSSSTTLWGIWFSGDYWHWKNIEIVGTPQYPGQNMSTGFRLEDSNHCIFEQVKFHDNFGTGFVMHGDSTDNLILNCDAYNNQDPLSSYANANGFMSVTNEGTTNTFRGCRAWWNCDDGFDHFNGNGIVIHESCWSFWNGYVPGTFTEAGDGMGFKFGQSQYSQGIVTRIATNCLAFNNLAWGFDQNDLDDKIRLDNCTAYQNEVGVRLGHKSQLHIVQNCLSYDNRTLEAYVNTGSVDDHNSWNSGVTVTAADFMSLDATGVDGPRGPAGALPVLDFLRLAPGSDLIDKGVDVGLPFQGAAPDLGAYERQ